MSLPRQFIIAVAAVCAGLALHGCGSGDSGGGGNPCDGKVFTIVSQKFEGTGKIDISVTKPQEGSGTVKTDQSIMFDLEKMNMYQAVTIHASGQGGGHKGGMQAEVKAIFNAAKKEFVYYVKGESTADGKTEPLPEMCKVVDMSQVPAQLLSPETVKMALGVLAQDVKCTSSDGAYTVFHYDVEVPSASMPIPMPEPFQPGSKVSSIGNYEVDTDNLLHSMDATEDVLMIIKDEAAAPVTVGGKANSKFSVTKASSGGPTDQDLDYSSWGKCTKESSESVSRDMLGFQQILQRSNHSRFDELVYAHALAGTPFHRFVQVVMQESSQSKSVEIV